MTPIRDIRDSERDIRDDGATLVEAVRELVDDFPSAPRPLVAAVTLLAEQLERNPTSTPMWGRFLQALEHLLEAWTRSQPVDEEVSSLVWQVRTGCSQHEPRPGERYRVHCAACCAEGRYAGGGW